MVNSVSYIVCRMSYIVSCIGDSAFLGRKGGISRAPARAFAQASGQIESEFYYDYAKQTQFRKGLNKCKLTCNKGL